MENGEAGATRPKARARKGKAGRGPNKGGNGRHVALPRVDNGSMLTRRELQCLQLLADGLRSEQIAFELKVARVTVDFHITNAKAKLKAITREQAVALAIRGGHLGA